LVGGDVLEWFIFWEILGWELVNFGSFYLGVEIYISGTSGHIFIGFRLLDIYIEGIFSLEITISALNIWFKAVS